MVFIGFGFLMVFLKSHSWTSVGLNFLSAAIAIQLAIFSSGFWHIIFGEEEFRKIEVNIDSPVMGDFIKYLIKL